MCVCVCTYVCVCACVRMCVCVCIHFIFYIYTVFLPSVVNSSGHKSGVEPMSSLVMEMILIYLCKESGIGFLHRSTAFYR